MAWPIVTLGEVLTPAGEPHRIDPERSYPIAGVFGFGRGVICRPPMIGAEMAAERLYRIRAGQVMYSRLKSFEGAFAIVPDEADGFFVSNEFPSFDVESGRADYRYLGWYLRRPATWSAFSGEGRGIGARRERLHPDQFLTHRLPLPPLDAQRRTVERLDAVEERIAQRQRAAEAMEAELATLLSSAFHRVAANAPRARMADIAPLVRRAISVELDGSYPELGVRSFGRGAFHKPPVTGAEVGTKRLFEVHAGDLVFSNVFAWEGAVAVAEPCDHGRVGSHRFITRVADSKRATARFLSFWFLTPDGLQKLGEASPGGAGRNRTLGLQALDAIEVPVPSLDAQQWFDTLQQKARAARDTQNSAGAELDHLLPALLAEAFGSG